MLYEMALNKYSLLLLLLLFLLKLIKMELGRKHHLCVAKYS